MNMLILFYLLAAAAMFAACRMMYRETSRDMAPDWTDWIYLVLVALLWPFAITAFGLLILGTVILSWDRYLLPRYTR